MLTLKAAGRLAAWTCIAVIAVLSLAPSADMVRTGAGGHIEHAVAYAGTTFLVAAAYDRWGRVAGALLVYAGVLETLQLFAPGRTSSLIDFLFSATGIMIGIAAVGLLVRVLPQELLAKVRPQDRRG